MCELGIPWAPSQCWIMCVGQERQSIHAVSIPMKRNLWSFQVIRAPVQSNSHQMTGAWKNVILEAQHWSLLLTGWNFRDSSSEISSLEHDSLNHHQTSSDVFISSCLLLHCSFLLFIRAIWAFPFYSTWVRLFSRLLRAT